MKLGNDDAVYSNFLVFNNTDNVVAEEVKKCLNTVDNIFA